MRRKSKHQQVSHSIRYYKEVGATSGEGFKESLSGGDPQDDGPYMNI